MDKKHNVSFKHRFILALIPLLVGFTRLIGMTMRITLIDPHHTSPYGKPAKPLIYAFWHNQQLLAAYFFRNFGIRVLVSRSRDGDYITRVLEYFGFRTVRSSTSSGKVNALRGLVRELKDGHHVAITPDGPRGPVYRAQPGVVFLGALSGHAVVPFGCASSRAWQLRSWDRFEIPKPFSKAVIVYDRAIPIPRRLTDEQALQLNEEIERQMNNLRDEARTILGLSGD
ncbi:MAG: lysophospholipid acyltransferase family protein [Deltaproteobacteria bacterium]|nr:lysophospholipid acyltransferase family protein [Deltaproteobacteria bacterium]